MEYFSSYNLIYIFESHDLMEIIVLNQVPIVSFLPTTYL